MALVICQVSSDDPRLARLLQLYLHEWSTLIPSAIGEDALFAYPELEDYGAPSTHRAFLFVQREAPVGFALAVRDEGGTWHVEEFFVIAGERRHGIGREAARLLFETARGPWTLTVRPENPKALEFWRAVVADASVELEIGDDGITRTRMSFDTSAGAIEKQPR